MWFFLTLQYKGKGWNRHLLWYSKMPYLQVFQNGASNNFQNGTSNNFHSGAINSNNYHNGASNNFYSGSAGSDNRNGVRNNHQKVVTNNFQNTWSGVSGSNLNVQVADLPKICQIDHGYWTWSNIWYGTEFNMHYGTYAVNQLSKLNLVLTYTLNQWCSLLE